MIDTISNLYYISPRDVRKNRADAVHIMLTCQSFANHGINVSLVTPTVERDEYITQESEIFNLYGIVAPNFDLIELKTKISEKKNEHSGKFRMAWEKLFSYSMFAINNLKEFKSEKTVIYSKCYTSILSFIFLKKLKLIKSPIIFETITPKNSFLHRIIYRNCDKIISHLKFVTEHIIEYSGVSKSKIFELPYYTQSKEIRAIKSSKAELRQKLGIHADDYVVLYAGKTGEKIKHVDYFLQAATELPEFLFYIVGANNQAKLAIEEKKKVLGLKNLNVFPFVPLLHYYEFVLASDLLIGYYDASFHNKYHLSPGKSGIYFASKNPCIFSDLPSLRAIFPDNVLFYAPPDKVELLVEKIKYVHDHPEIAHKVAEAANDFAIRSSYDNMGKSVLEFIN